MEPEINHSAVSEVEDTKESFIKRLSRFGHRLCVKHDFLSSGKIKGETRDVRKYYDYLAPFYDFIYRRSDSYLHSGQFVVDNFIQNDDLLLDLGAGTGHLTIPAIEKASFIISYDLHNKMLKQGMKKAEKAIRKSSLPSADLNFCQGDALALPFASSSFSIVASAFMLVYLSPEQNISCLKECRRVLKSDGRIVLLTSQGEIHSRFFSKEQWISIFSEAGFSEPEFSDFNDVFRTIHAKIRT